METSTITNLMLKAIDLQLKIMLKKDIAQFKASTKQVSVKKAA